MILKKIIVKYLYNEANESELRLLKDWLKKDEHKEEFKRYIRLHYLMNKVNVSSTNDDDYEKLFNKISKSYSPQKSGGFLLNRVWVRYSVAASIILLISIGFFYKQNVIEENTPKIVNNKIEIGTDKAILTLDDGTDIILGRDNTYLTDNIESSEEEIIYKASHSGEPKVSFNYLTIPRGGQYQMTLMDGTKVWINSDSKLKYPTYFEKGEPRKLELIYGEAYFDVTPSAQNNFGKFSVCHDLQIIKVLGTEFNIKAYSDDHSIYTTLVEGKIKLDASGEDRFMSPSEQATLDKRNNSVVIKHVNTYEATAWKEGVFSFKRKPLKEIMKVLSRWYDMNVVFEDKKIEDLKFIGTLYRRQSIEEIMFSIKNTNLINNYTINNKTITLY